MQSCNILLRSSSASKLVSWRIRRRRIHCRQTHRSPLLLVTPDGTSTTTNPILCKCLFCIAILSYLTFITAGNLFGFQLDVGLASFLFFCVFYCSCAMSQFSDKLLSHLANRTASKVGHLTIRYYNKWLPMFSDINGIKLFMMVGSN